VYNGDSGFEQLETLNNTVAQSLMRKIDEAIRKHLVTTQST
jgi:hypothetical protein